MLEHAKLATALRAGHGIDDAPLDHRGRADLDRVIRCTAGDELRELLAVAHQLAGISFALAALGPLGSIRTFLAHDFFFFFFGFAGFLATSFSTGFGVAFFFAGGFFFLAGSVAL